MEILSRAAGRLFAGTEVFTLCDSDATRSAVLQTLDEVAQAARPEDVFVFYYAGHGTVVEDMYYFVTHENTRLYDQAALAQDAISMQEVQREFSQIRALKQLVVKAVRTGAPRDGKITVYELKAYLDDQVPILTERNRGEAQYPITFSRGRDFPLIVN